MPIKRFHPAAAAAAAAAAATTTTTTNSMFLDDLFLMIFGSTFDRLLIKNDSESLGPEQHVSSLVRPFYPHKCTFYLSKTYKCQKPFFPTFCTCTFYAGKAYRCAVTVFTI